MGPVETRDQSVANSTLPVIDFSRWTSAEASKSDRLAMAKGLVQACHETGFVYLINHGVTPELLEEAFAWSKKFYALPTEDKMKAGHLEGSMAFRGYSWPGLEKGSKVYPGSELVKGLAPTEEESEDFTESYGIGSDENLEEPNVWLPEEVLPGWRAFMTKFYWECWKASQNILRALALGLGLEDEEYFLHFHDGHDNELNPRYYPPIAESVIASQKMQRLHPHSDFDSFTMLFQDDCGGLEVLKQDGGAGKFINADPIKNALVMNIGDMLMRWSNDYLVSTIHRVHLPPLQDRYTGEERMTRARYSIPYFVSGKRETLIECLPVCHSESNPPKYEPVLWSDYYQERIKQVFPEHTN